ncbi:Wzz/FepE/Etk N-terminal domain-containing protein [Nonomuraea cavernae]|uniref:Polysaccharide chain length determinant N-terminal domain-containing protein n=1 Tax=Nonomuraea cavernae TaxID=2045107 RepID=A0A918DJJ8_9ACTN|nr:Wzz/FepE/Etk N-terminal domain-containing protein [Nonomuraea cavernae]MCA2186087.1 hypothetical protein [Nonomuraea cavernae]GGO70249.1 hypothetical protein GCM10012289_33260 [Nonomuraea cavernae]
MAALNPDPTLAGYAAFVRRHLITIVLLVAAGTGAGLIQGMLTPPTYTASTQVFAPATPVHPGLERKPDQRLPRDVTIDTEAQLLRSSPVMDRVAAALGVNRQGAAEAITISVPANSRLITVQVRDRDPERALAAVIVATDSYLSLRRQIVAGIRQRQLEALQSRIGVVEVRLDTLSKGSVRRDAASRTRRASMIRQINELERQVSRIQRQSETTGEVVRAASVPRRPDRDNNEVPVASYAALGLLAGVVMGMLRDRRGRVPAPSEGAVRHEPEPEPDLSARLGDRRDPRPAGSSRSGP